MKGRGKGGAFERLICKQLSMAMTRGLRTDLFWRTAMSGGRATLMRRRGEVNMSQTGDVTAIDPLGNWLTDQFLIECKHHRDVGLQHYLLNRKGKIAEWVKTARLQAGHHKPFLLVFKQNNIPTLVLTDAVSIDNVPRSANYGFRPLLTLETSFGKYLSLMTFDHLIAVISHIHADAGAVTVRRRPAA